jgi:hypothetical protein
MKLRAFGGLTTEQCSEGLRKCSRPLSLIPVVWPVIHLAESPAPRSFETLSNVGAETS